jgi:uncharacterized membrane protein
VFLFRGVESHPRSFVKAVTWRALGSIDTFVLSLIYTGNTAAAGAIAGTEVFTKIFLFYFHERIWSLIRWGHLTPVEAADEARETYSESNEAPSAPAR